MKKSRMYVAHRRGFYALYAAVIVGLLHLASATSVFAAEKTFTCTPVNVAVFPNSRIHVKCSSGDGPIVFFALGVKDDGEANRVLSLLSAAFATKKQLSIFYNPDDLEGAKIGCLTSDCRLIRGVVMF